MGIARERAATAFVITHEPDPERSVKGLSVQALTLTRALGRRGIPVVRLHPNHLESSLESRYCQAVHCCPDMYQSEERLVEFLLALESKYPGKRVLIPASDDSAFFLSKYWDVLADCFELPTPGPHVMENIIDKRKQYDAARSVGVPIPDTFYPQTPEEAKELAGLLDHYPYVIKPTVAHQWRLSTMQGVAQGRKGILVEDADQLVDEYRRLEGHASEVMLQEVIQGRDEQLFTFLTYFNGKSEPLGYCIRRKIRQLPIDFGYCTLTESCTNELVEQQSIKLLKGIRYRGIAGVEWKLDPRTGEFKLIEINARAVNTIGIASACGVDLPYIAFTDSVGGDAVPVFNWVSGVKWVRATQDIWAARSLHARGDLDMRQWLISLKGKKVDAVFAGDDLRPFVSDLGVVFKRQLSARLNKLFKGSRPSPV